MSGSNMLETRRLAELLATRLCHDLSSPLNGIGAGLSSGDAALVSEAATTAVNRLILLRAAWGEPGEPLDLAGLRRMVGYLPRRRVTVDLSHLPDDAMFQPEAARLMLNVLLLAAEALPRGGTVLLDGDAARGVVVTPHGEGAAWPEGFTGLIADPDSALEQVHDLPPHLLQAPWTIILAHSTGQRLSLLLGAAASPVPPLLVGFAEA